MSFIFQALTSKEGQRSPGKFSRLPFMNPDSRFIKNSLSLPSPIEDHAQRDDKIHTSTFRFDMHSNFCQSLDFPKSPFKNDENFADFEKTGFDFKGDLYFDILAPEGTQSPRLGSTLPDNNDDNLQPIAKSTFPQFDYSPQTLSLGCNPPFPFEMASLKLSGDRISNGQFKPINPYDNMPDSSIGLADPDLFPVENPVKYTDESLSSSAELNYSDDSFNDDHSKDFYGQKDIH